MTVEVEEQWLGKDLDLKRSFFGLFDRTLVLLVLLVLLVSVFLHEDPLLRQ